MRGFVTNERCPCCGAPFERRGEGDFVLAMLLAYSVAVAGVLVAIFLLNRYTALGTSAQVGITATVATGILLVGYRSLKGVWIAILIAIVKWGGG